MIGSAGRYPHDALHAKAEEALAPEILVKLNKSKGDFIAAEMVKAFISSSEYRQRFGP